MEGKEKSKDKENKIEERRVGRERHYEKRK